MRYLFLMFRGFLTYRRRKYIHQRPRRCCPTSWRRALGHAASRRTVENYGLWTQARGMRVGPPSPSALRQGITLCCCMVHSREQHTKKKARHVTHLCFWDVLPLCLGKPPQQTFFPARGAKHTPVLPPRHIPGCPSPVSHLLWFFVNVLDSIFILRACKSEAREHHQCCFPGSFSFPCLAPIKDVVLRKPLSTFEPEKCRYLHFLGSGTGTPINGTTQRVPEDVGSGR